MVDAKWVAARLAHQKNRAALSGGDFNPLQEKAKRTQSDLRKNLCQSSTADARSVFAVKPSSGGAQATSAPSVSSDSALPSLRFSSYLEQSKQKKKQKKKRKKDKKKKQRVMGSLSDKLMDADERNGNLLAEMMKFSKNLIMVDGELWLYSNEDGCYHLSSYNQIARSMRSSLSYDDTLKLTSRDYKESFQQLLISEELVREGGFLRNKPYVNCQNGVLDVFHRKLLEHSPEWMFRHCVQAQYIPGSKCPRFLDYVDYITAGDKELKRLLQVLMGYIWSSYCNGRVAILIYGVSGTGKSVLCRLVGRILGDKYLAHTDLSMLQKPEFVAALSGKMLNIAPDLKNEPLRDVGFFKSLVSHNDSIATRALYANPKTVQGGDTKMLFSSNHLLEFDSALGDGDIEAVFNRIIFFPYQNSPVDRSQDNKHLSDELYEERDGIFSWAMEGLREYVKDGEVFPIAKASEELKKKNMAKYCPERIFYETCMKKEDEKYESVTAVKEAYESFCLEAGVSSSRKGKITDYLEEQKKIGKAKKRIDDDGFLSSGGNPIWVYENIRIRKKYRV